MLGNETITNEFYRYILSNLKGNQKSKWKLCLRKAYKGEKLGRGVYVPLCVYFLKKTPSGKGNINFSSTQIKENPSTEQSECPATEMQGSLGRTASNHLDNTSTDRIDDSLFCN